MAQAASFVVMPFLIIGIILVFTALDTILLCCALLLARLAVSIAKGEWPRW